MKGTEELKELEELLGKIEKKEWKKSIREAIDFAMEHDV